MAGQNQALSFAELLAGGVILAAGISGYSIPDVVLGRATGVRPLTSDLPAKPSGGGGGSSGGAGGSGPLSPGTYVNPLSGAHTTPERIDMGVDYAGSGPVGALGNSRITGATRNSGWPGGGWVQGVLLDGPYKGRTWYVAEGIVPVVSVGKIVRAGEQIASIIPGSSTGIEMGWGSGSIGQTYAQASGGGYSEGWRTAAGQAFSDLMHQLGGQAGTIEGRAIHGHFP